MVFEDQALDLAKHLGAPLAIELYFRGGEELVDAWVAVAVVVAAVVDADIR